MNTVIVHYQEIALKGRNRPYFIGKLVRNVRRMTADVGVADVRALMGRIEMVLKPEADYAAVRERLQHVFGIANFSKSGHAPVDLEGISKAIIDDLHGVETPSFRVSVKRGTKTFPMTSPQIEREIGGRIKEARGWKVDLDHAALTVRVEMLKDEAFYHFDRDKGPGGLPTGVSGRVAALMSGGIDSPVAAFRLMKRGCSVVLVHFHSYPFLSRASQEKVRDIARLLTRHQMRTRLHLVPFGELQRQVVLTVPPGLRVVIYRRLMLRIAERIALDADARALVTGESIGQVASQTLDNMTVIAGATRMPVLRPLVGMDKEEIVAEAQRIGTYDISIVPDEDCCQLFTPRSPETHARLGIVEHAESKLPIDEMITSALQGTVVEKFRFPAAESRT
ncbi:MAG: tRNA uracil 4-sulfurtransferase ThiI [Vicinamibacterales bacterium]|nr:tRNA uracil 4-sulfurtransferase ThiI [Vicinamibacterales bacterium]